MDVRAFQSLLLLGAFLGKLHQESDMDTVFAFGVEKYGVN